MIKIRKISSDEAEVLQKIATETFTETFSADNNAEDFQNYLDEKLNLNQLKSELSNENSEFYLLESGDKIAGYLKLNFKDAQTENQPANAMEIERIYVLQKFQGKKLGQVLLDKAIEIAKERNAEYIWLGVWEFNEKALRFYRKNGFEVFSAHIFKVGTDEQTDLLMRIDL